MDKILKINTFFLKKARKNQEICDNFQNYSIMDHFGEGGGGGGGAKMPKLVVGGILHNRPKI